MAKIDPTHPPSLPHANTSCGSNEQKKKALRKLVHEFATLDPSLLNPPPAPTPQSAVGLPKRRDA